MPIRTGSKRIRSCVNVAFEITRNYVVNERVAIFKKSSIKATFIRGWICSDPFGDRIHLGTDPQCLHGTSSKLKRYGSIWDHLQQWTHLVPDSRSDPYRIHQVPCKHKAYPYPSRTGSKRIQSRGNTVLKTIDNDLNRGLLSLDT